MKIIKRILLLLFILITIGFIFRGWLYRHLVTYESVGARTHYSVTNNKLADYINSNTQNQAETDIEQIIKLGLLITSRKLNFTVENNNIDPNQLISSKTAHCEGYASFFATTCNFLLKKYNLSNKWKAEPQAGQISFLGINIHEYFHSSFFKYHDFVTIENKQTGEIFAVDPSVNDYLFIDFVTLNK